MTMLYLLIDFIMGPKNIIATNKGRNEGMDIGFLPFCQFHEEHECFVDENKSCKIPGVCVGCFKDPTELVL